MRTIIKNVTALITVLAVPAIVFAADAVPAPAVKLYGFTKLDVIYATQRTFAGDLNFYLLPTIAGKNQPSLNITARETRFGLDISGPSIEDWKTTGKVELDFYTSAFGGGNENNAAPRIRLAYVDFVSAQGLSVRAGQDWDTLVTVTPKTVDAAFLGGYGNLYGRRPQVRVTQTLKFGAVSVTARAAAARTIGQVTDAGGIQDGGTDAVQPTLEGAFFADATLWTTRPARVSISGHSGFETVAPVAADPTLKNYDTRSLIGGLVLPITDRATIQGTVWQGADLKQFYGGINQGINTTLGQSIEAQGGWAQLVLDVLPVVNVNLGYGYDDPSDSNLNTGDRTLNTRSFGSVIYQASSAVSFAFEYSSLRTGYKNAATSNGEIYQAAAIFKF